MNDSHQVRLEIPADPNLLRVARLTAAGLAGRLGYNFDEIEDVKIAVDELCHALLPPEGNSGTISITYRMGPTELTIEGRGRYDEPVEPAASTVLSGKILDAVVDEHDLASDGNELTFRMTKSKKAG